MTLFRGYWGRAFLGKFSQKTTGQNVVKDPEMLGHMQKTLKKEALTLFRS
jgi:hypothetical protein